jgi:hypothetical protein
MHQLEMHTLPHKLRPLESKTFSVWNGSDAGAAALRWRRNHMSGKKNRCVVCEPWAKSCKDCKRKIAAAAAPPPSCHSADIPHAIARRRVRSDRALQHPKRPRRSGAHHAARGQTAATTAGGSRQRTRFLRGLRTQAVKCAKILPAVKVRVAR